MDNNVQILPTSANLATNASSDSTSAFSILKTSSSFIRVSLDNFTAVIEKKQNSLKEELEKKFKCRNIDFEDYVVYDRNTKFLIDLNDNNISCQDMVLRRECEVKHILVTKRLSIKDKIFSTSRNCQFCSKPSARLTECQKCNLTVCQMPECVEKSRMLICPPESPKRNKNSKFSKSRFMSMARPATLKRKRFVQNSSSHQTIPEQSMLKIEFSPRIRSFSDPDIWNNATHVPETIQEKPETSNEGEKECKNSSNISSSNDGPSTPETPTKSPRPKRPNRWSSLINWEIPTTRIKIHKHYKLGHGSFGVVHKGVDFYHGVVAVKFLNMTTKPSPSQIAAFKNEVAILKSTRHENILLFIGCFLNEQLAIVTEWCPGSSLYRHLHVEEVHWEMHELIDIARQTCQGMEYLHAKDILHRDLKSNNIFLVPNESSQNGPLSSRSLRSTKWLDSDENEEDEDYYVSKWTVKIGDFGLATFKSINNDDDHCNNNNNNNKKLTGSVLWMAPEVINQKVKDPYTQKSDVYSFAVVLYELVTSNLPFQNFPHKEPNLILFWVGRGLLKLDLSQSRADTPEEIKELIMICSDFDRDNRLDFLEISKRLKQLRLSKPPKIRKLKRIQSTPNMYFKFQSTLAMPPNSDSSANSTPSSLVSPNFFPPNFYHPNESIERVEMIFSDILVNETSQSKVIFS